MHVQCINVSCTHAYAESPTVLLYCTLCDFVERLTNDYLSKWCLKFQQFFTLATIRKTSRTSPMSPPTQLDMVSIVISCIFC